MMMIFEDDDDDDDDDDDGDSNDSWSNFQLLPIDLCHGVAILS